MQGSSRSALAESLVLRGPRRGGVALQAQQAADLLDQSLMLEGRLTGTQQFCTEMFIIGVVFHTVFHSVL